MRNSALLILALACGCGGRVAGYESPSVETGPSIEDTDLRTGEDSSPADTADALVADTGPPTLDELVKPCLAGGNIIYFNGDPKDWIHPGIETITGGEWVAPFENPRYFGIRYKGPIIENWSLTFSSINVGADLAAGLYEDAERAPRESAGHPGLEIIGGAAGCEKISGRFKVYQVRFTDPAINSFTASFEQHCEKQKPALRGCIHYERTEP